MDQDFTAFAALDDASDRAHYITSMHTFQMMRSIVNPQSLSTFLLIADAKEEPNFIKNRLYIPA